MRSSRYASASAFAYRPAVSSNRQASSTDPGLLLADRSVSRNRLYLELERCMDQHGPFPCKDRDLRRFVPLYAASQVCSKSQVAGERRNYPGGVLMGVNRRRRAQTGAMAAASGLYLTETVSLDPSRRHSHDNSCDYCLAYFFHLYASRE